ncbi:MAG: hypothetical protein MK098_09905 [Marinovum sp.]|nr:hypothetical protein [Marinovum sp.]
MHLMFALAISATATTLFSGSAMGQSFDAAPIVLDTAGVGDQPLVIIAAYSPRDTPAIVSLGPPERTALRTPRGMPRPSLVLGLVSPGTEDAYGITSLLPATIDQFGFSWQDVAAREALRDSDPNLLFQLIQEGHLDPPPAELNVALQTDLQRMNCYRSTIDGIWGGGSAGSVERYLSTLKVPDILGDPVNFRQRFPDRQPSNELFRFILRWGDVACPGATRVRNTVSTTTRAPAATTPQSGPADTSSGTRRRSGTGTGVFR